MREKSRNGNHKTSDLVGGKRHAGLYFRACGAGALARRI